MLGVTKKAKAATGRKGIGKFTEDHKCTFRRVAVSAITPPVFRLGIHRLGDGRRAVAVIVPTGVDGPHQIFRGEYFGALRNNADTEWMKERQIEAMCRARLDERRRATEVVDSVYAEAAAGRDTANKAWLIAVAHPRLPGTVLRLSRETAQAIFKQAERITLSYANLAKIHPLENVDYLNPRPGLRRWVAPTSAEGDSSRWREAWASAHHDGSATLAAAIGGHRKRSDGNFEGWEVEARAVEAAVADITALIRATATALHHGKYDVWIGVVWTGDEPLKVLTVDGMGFAYDGVSTPLSKYSPVRSTIDAAASDAAFHQQVHKLAQDCVNQGESLTCT